MINEIWTRRQNMMEQSGSGSSEKQKYQSWNIHIKNSLKASPFYERTWNNAGNVKTYSLKSKTSQ